MARWWEWDGTQAGPNRTMERSTEGDFRFPLLVLALPTGFLSLLAAALLSLFFRDTAFAGWFFGIGIACLLVSWIALPKDTKRT